MVKIRQYAFVCLDLKFGVNDNIIKVNQFIPQEKTDMANSFLIFN